MSAGEAPLAKPSSEASAKLLALDARFELRELLGEGGMGAVYCAWDRTLERSVALKFIRGADPSLAERLLLEARLQARVEHANVGKVYEVGEHQGRACIALQLIRGKSLEALAKEISLRERVLLLRQVCEAVHAAHLTGLVHRDLKPGNILVEDEGNSRKAYVTDFGLARGPQESGISRAGVPVGTLLFMSPEQAAAESPIDFRSDIYSLGATLYSLLVQHPPFARAENPRATPPDTPTGAQPNHQSSLGGFYGLFGSQGEAAQVQLLHQVLAEDPPAPRSIDRTVPYDLETIARRCLRKNPGERYPTALALAEELTRYLEGRPILARPPSVFHRFTRLLQRHRALAFASLAIIVLAALGAGLSARNAAKARAREREREAILQRFDQTILDATYRLRLANMAPLHDRTPQVRPLQASIDAVKSDMDRLGEIAQGPGHQAIGMGLLELDRTAEASENLEQAWALAVRSPESAEALAWALYLGVQGSPHPGSIASGEGDSPRKKEANKARAIEVLGNFSGTGTPFSPALLLALKGDVQGALAAAEALLKAEPWHERALFLVFRLRSRLSGHGGANGSRDEALGESEAALARLVQLQPSNPNAWHQAWTWAVGSSFRARNPREQQAAWQRGLAAVKNEVATGPDQLRAALDLDTAYVSVAELDVELGESPLEHVALGLQANTRALAIEPESSRPMTRLDRLSLHLSRAHWLLLQHLPESEARRAVDNALDDYQALGKTLIGNYESVTVRISLAETLALRGEDPRRMLEQCRTDLLAMASDPDAGANEAELAETTAWLALLAVERGEDPSALLAEAKTHSVEESGSMAIAGKPKVDALRALTCALQDRAQKKNPAAHDQAFVEALQQGRAEAPGDALIHLLLQKAAALHLVLE